MEQFRFRSDYQDLAIACLIRHHEVAWLGTLLKPGYFTGVVATVVSRAALDYYRERGHMPSFTVLRQLAANASAKLGRDSESAQAAEYVDKLEAMDTRDWQYVRDTLAHFARERAVTAAIRQSIELIKEGKEPDGGYVKLFSEAVAVGQNLDDLGIVLHADYEKVIDKTTDSSYGISTGWPLLDNVWRGGLKPGWLVVPLAPPKRWKTAMSICMAVNMVSPNIAEDVVYYACEISQELAMMRALCNIAGLTMNAAYDDPAAFKAKVAAEIKKKVAGTLIFKTFAAKQASIAEIKAHLTMLTKELSTDGKPFAPKAVFIDYAETIAPEKSDAPDYRQQSAIYVGARSIASQFNCTVIMPDRCNRETVDQPVPNMKSFQGAFEKAGVVDVSYGICSTEEEHMANQLRIFLFLNRHGKAGVHLKAKVDPETWRIEITDTLKYEPDTGTKVSGRKRKDDLPDELLDDLPARPKRA
jgi:hypothetical protein